MKGAETPIEAAGTPVSPAPSAVAHGFIATIVAESIANMAAVIAEGAHFSGLRV